jgi:hypothetical protein
MYSTLHCMRLIQSSQQGKIVAVHDTKSYEGVQF